jgi:hypothetical protein
MQHPKTTENSADFPDVKRGEWEAEEVANESVNQMPDESLRQILRGEESDKNNSDDNDIVGASDSNDTPEGRERAKVKNKNP